MDILCFEMDMDIHRWDGYGYPLWGLIWISTVGMDMDILCFEMDADIHRWDGYYGYPLFQDGYYGYPLFGDGYPLYGYPTTSWQR